MYVCRWFQCVHYACISRTIIAYHYRAIRNRLVTLKVSLSYLANSVSKRDAKNAICVFVRVHRRECYLNFRFKKETKLLSSEVR